MENYRYRIGERGDMRKRKNHKTTLAILAGVATTVAIGVIARVVFGKGKP